LPRLGHAVEDGKAFVRGAAFAGRDATDDVRAVLAALFGVEGPLAPGDALNDDARALVCPDGHFLSQFRQAEACRHSGHMPNVGTGFSLSLPLPPPLLFAPR